MYFSDLPSATRRLPRWSAFISLVLSQAEDLLAAVPAIQASREIPVAAGVCLNRLGRLLGLDRRLSFPNSALPEVLSDDDYRLVLLARVHALRWDGTNAGFQACLDAVFPPDLSPVTFSDGGDRTLTFHVPENLSDARRALLRHGLLSPKPPGVTLCCQGCLASP